MKVIHGKYEYECLRAVKGPNYIKLLDEYNTVILSIGNISDFSEFVAEDGEFEIERSIEEQIKELKEIQQEQDELMAMLLYGDGER